MKGKNGFRLAATAGLLFAGALTACNPKPSPTLTLTPLKVRAQGEGVELTVYNQNIALVKDRRTLDLRSGLNEVKFADVASGIDPTSVHFASLSDPRGTSVLEQNYEYDVVGTQKLLTKYLDQQVSLVAQDGAAYSGKLLSGAEDIVLQAADGSVDVIKLDQVRQISFPKLPEGLITRPTLVWLLEAAKAGPQGTEVTYLTGGINWRADYVVILAADDKSLGLNGWVTVDNHSGATYKDAKLKLVAGDINLVQAAQEVIGYDRAVKATAAPPGPQVTERTFFEYHLYDVQRPVTVKDNQTKQIEFASGEGVKADKFFVYDGLQGYYFGFYGSPITDAEYGPTSNTKVMVMLEFKNDEASGLGIPLPKGTVRVYKKDTDGTTQFVGEDSIDHTPKDERVRLYLGDAFDIVGERVRTDFAKPGERSMEESFEISVRNHKTEAVEVRVVEHLFRWSEWQITRSSSDYSKLDASTVEFRVNVPKDGEAKITYTVRYRW